MTRVAPLLALLFATPMLVACGGDEALPPVTPVERTSIALGTPTPATLQQGRTDRYTVAVTQGTSYVVSLTSLTDSALSLRVDNGGAISSNSQTTSPKDVTVQAAGTSLAIDVGSASLVKPTGNYVVTVVPAPVASVPIVGTSGAIAARTPTVGWVATRSTSRYQTTGLTGTHTVSIVGLTGDAQLHLYADETYSMEQDCTLRHPEARECVVSSAGAYYSVTAGGVNRDGAGYVILVW
jgi:hypothetical protein